MAHRYFQNLKVSQFHIRGCRLRASRAEGDGRQEETRWWGGVCGQLQRLAARNASSACQPPRAVLDADTMMSDEQNLSSNRIQVYNRPISGSSATETSA